MVPLMATKAFTCCLHAHNYKWGGWAQISSLSLSLVLAEFWYGDRCTYAVYIRICISVKHDDVFSYLSMRQDEGYANEAGVWVASKGLRTDSMLRDTRNSKLFPFRAFFHDITTQFDLSKEFTYPEKEFFIPFGIQCLIG